MIITIVAADIGKSDHHFANIVGFSEVDYPPRPWPGVEGARKRRYETVNSGASGACISLIADLDCIFAGRQAVCSKYINNPLRLRSHTEV